MPYGVAKSLGGDNPVNDNHMERQVKAIMDSSGLDKISAIKIAKSSMAKGRKKPKEPQTLGEYLSGKT